MSYEFRKSIEVNVGKASAWQFWTNVENWRLDPDVESVNLNGLFQIGTCGTTKSRSAGIVRWQITEVCEQESATIEIPLPGATVRFSWQFEELTEAKTKLTQQIVLEGEEAEAYVTQLGAGFEQGIRDGMQKLRAAMEQDSIGS
jgi:hypothetical protein